MPDWIGVGKTLILVGGVLVLLGALLTLLGKLGSDLGWFGRLPGDILIKRENFTLYFPLTTGILISVALSLLLYFLSKR
ncbi:MAG: DUF2905 domain-containing protein [Nitrospiraceae bacterium]